MKAIQITQQLKDTNPELFGGVKIGFIRQYSDVPNSFYSLNYNQGQRTDGYNLLGSEIHQQDGFLDLIFPEINDKQKLGEIILDNENYTYEIVLKSNEEIYALYLEKLQSQVVDLRIRAKGLAIGKIGANAYILAQVDFYEIKYENASNPNPITEIDDDLAAEGMRDFGMNLSDFKDLIITMYQAGKQKETLLMSFIEQGRSAILTLMANANWTAVDQAFLLTEELRGITAVEQARIIKNQILEL